jgi:hypothetical protein
VGEEEGSGGERAGEGEVVVVEGEEMGEVVEEMGEEKRWRWSFTFHFCDLSVVLCRKTAR